jgi:uncharacterized membrane protein HdeD (DUF308 family)
VLSAAPSTRGTTRPTIEATICDRRRHEVIDLQSHTSDEVKVVMNSILGQQHSKWALGRQLWKCDTISGVLTAVLGCMILAWPGPSILVASTLFGVYLLVTGFAQLFLAFTLPASAATRVVMFIIGVLSLVLAVLSFRHFGDAYAILLLSLWVGISFVIQGIAGVAAGISERELPGRGWYIVLGIVSVMAGVVVLIWPFDSIVVLALAAGVWLIVFGVIQLVRAFQIRKDARDASDVVDALSQRLAA